MTETNAAPPPRDERRFFMWCAFVIPAITPLLVLLLVVLVNVILKIAHLPIPDTFIQSVVTVSGVGIFAVLIGGVPYYILATIGALALRTKTPRAAKLWGLTLPLQLAGIFSPIYFHDASLAAFLCACCLAFGYCYVAIAFALNGWLNRCHAKRLSVVADKSVR